MIDPISIGTIMVSLPEASTHDIAGNNNAASTSTDNTVTILSGIPGGVGANLGLWLKADAGATSALWEDQSGNDNDAIQNFVADQPTITTNIINFNPALEFNQTELQTTSPNSNNSGEFVHYDIPSLNANSYRQTRMFIVGTKSANNQNFAELGDDVDRGIGGRNNNTFELYDTYSENGAPNAGNITLNTPILYNGLNTLNSFGVGFPDPAITSLAIGRGIVGFEHLVGNIAEMVLLPSSITAVEIQRVESYLAIKYGITLDQSTATDYLASDGSTLWDAALNSVYNNDIAGIVRDDTSGLLQKVARSVNENSVVTIALDNDIDIANNDATRTSTFANDLEAMVWANNGASRGFTTTNLPTGANSDDIDVVLERIWQVQEIGDVAGAAGDLHIAFDLNNIQTTGGTPAATDVYLLINGTDDFTGVAGANTLNTGTLVGNQIVFTVPEADLETGQFFTLGCAINGELHTAPGGVLTDLSLWYKANDNGSTIVDDTTVSTWMNHGLGNDAVSLQDPSYQSDLASLINFNPVIENDSDDIYIISSAPTVETSTMFAVGIPSATGNLGNINTLFRGGVTGGIGDDSN